MSRPCRAGYWLDANSALARNPGTPHRSLAHRPQAGRLNKGLDTMTRMKTLLSATAVALLLAVPAIGPAAAQSRGHTLYFVPPTGKVMAMDMTMSADKEAMLMKHAHKLPPGSIVYTTDGDIWVAEDGKMTDGKMLSDALMH
jgi:hypothetical protein